MDALNYKLTILQASAGYGKSTELAALAEETGSAIWYQVTEEDGDPLVFLLHLCHATLRVLPDLKGLPVKFLEEWEGEQGPLPSAGVIDQFINVLSEQLDLPVLLIVDDLHTVDAASEIGLILDRLAGLAPFHLHILLASRTPIRLPNLSRWRAQGRVLTLDQSVLAFDAAEISALFSQHYGVELTQDETNTLLANTEGWAIALQLIWQSLRSGSFVSVEESLTTQAGSLEGLFDILAREVFDGQPPDVQQFLLVSATLREMTAEACDALRYPGENEFPTANGIPHLDSAGMLAYLRRQELFVVEHGDGSLRYHHIFHTFLRQQASPIQRKVWHICAAGHFRSQGDFDATAYHLLLAEDQEAAADLLDTFGSQLLTVGRLDSLAQYLDSIRPAILHQHPALLSYLGDLARLHSRFQEALGWYQQAEEVWQRRGQMDGAARALRGQARVYLDTVNPSRAEELLQKSIRLSDGMESRESQARLYELLAENRLNAGKADEAERLRQQAEALRSEGPSDSQLLFRVLLRTGRLEEARLRLESRAEAERDNPVQTPRAHRETLLLLSLIYAFQGKAEEAYQAALEGTRRGVDLQSPYVTAVGYMRQGHALMLLQEGNRSADVRQQFLESIQLSRMLAVPRLTVESCWGLCREAGYRGDLAQALEYAQEGIEIANQAGDEWIASLTRLAVGASLTLSSRYEAAKEWLEHASLGFQECSDPFGRTASRLWICLGWFRQDNFTSLEQVFPDLLRTCRESGYDFLLTRPTLLGPPDERIFIPLLIHARDHGWEPKYAASLLASLGLEGIQFHPGYRLRVVTIGNFQTWLGIQPVLSNGWRREKARQLFQVLLTFRDAPLDRDQIIEYLWPGQDPATAGRNFKVALNALYQVLEPERQPGSESTYILREGSIYGLRPGADLWLDAVEFVKRIREGENLLETRLEEGMKIIQSALDLYQGEYLPEARYETWTAAEREHLAVLFLRAADRLSDLYLQNGEPQKSAALCQRILSCDNCWERAYRHLMLAYDRMGDHGQLARTYQRCVQTLRQELDVSPAPETDALYRKLTSNR